MYICRSPPGLTGLLVDPFITRQSSKSAGEQTGQANTVDNEGAEMSLQNYARKVVGFKLLRISRSQQFQYVVARKKNME